MTILVCTGTQRGTTPPQYAALKEHVRTTAAAGDTEGWHGVAVGVDAEFHAICRGFGVPLRGYPAKGIRNLEAKSADIPASEFAVLMPAEYPLDRNHRMIDYAVLSSETSRLVVCPKGDYEELRSGTWATVRYARHYGMDILLLWPSDGALELRVPGDPHYHSRIRHV